MLKERLHTVLVCAAFLTGFSGGVVAQEEIEPRLKSPAEQAWRYFLLANRTVENNELTWQTWTNQNCVANPGSCDNQKFSTSHLQRANISTELDDNGCTPMLTKANAGKLGKYIPANLSDQPVYCEQVYINDIEMKYLRELKLLTAQDQAQFLGNGRIVDVTTGNFYTAGIEVKANWVPASSYTNVEFDCTRGSDQIYLTEFDGVCHGLVGLHIIVKQSPKWLWASFEPQYPLTNPNRCNPGLYNPCFDSFGSVPATSTGDNTQRSLKLRALFGFHGEAIPPAFRNYRLTGVQTDYDTPIYKDHPAQNWRLGNSFVELNAGVDPQQASCITCHSYAARNIDNCATSDVISDVGHPKPLAKDFRKLDFSWFLAFSVPGVPESDHPSCKKIKT
ncbi:MAG: hypothetical protein MI750_15845 [Xanthomonadales bacterium]|jgi:hypothetical protein|nr:hypothetical protein [Xanthomonadales bacterium]